MKVSVQLTDQEVRDIIKDHAYSMLPDEVLGVDNSEVDIEITAYGLDRNDEEAILDLSDPGDWAVEVTINANSGSYDNEEVSEDLEEDEV